MTADSSESRSAGTAPSPTGGFGWKKLLILVGIVAAAGLVYFQFREYFSLEALAEEEAGLLAFGERRPVLVVMLAFLVYVVVTGLTFPVATMMSVTIGWYFKLLFGERQGFLVALVLVSFASTSGSTLAFLMSRYLFRDTIRNRFGERLRKFDEELEREGAFYLFMLRLIPGVPYFVINTVMGVTPIRVWTFWWVSQLGMLPATCVYVYAGWTFPSLQQLAERGVRDALSPQIVIALLLLGIFPLAARKLRGLFRRSSWA